MVHVLAALGFTSNGYRILLLLHILMVIIGFGSTFVYPIMGRQAAKRRGIEAQALSETSLIAAKAVTTPVIYAAGAFGLILVLAGPHDFDELWIQLALSVFIVLVLFAGLVHVPNLVKMDQLTRELATMSGPPPGGAAGPPPQAVEMEQRAKRAPVTAGLLDLGLIVLLILMIWKPT